MKNINISEFKDPRVIETIHAYLSEQFEQGKDFAGVSFIRGKVILHILDEKKEEELVTATKKAFKEALKT